MGVGFDPASFDDSEEQTVLSDAVGSDGVWAGLPKHGGADDAGEIEQAYIDEIGAVLEALPGAVLLFDSRGKMLFQNRQARRLGFNLLSLEGTKIPSSKHPLGRLLHGESVFEEEYLLKTIDGSSCVVALSGAVVGSGSKRYIVIEYRDLTPFRQPTDKHADYLRAITHDLKSPLGILTAQVQTMALAIEQGDQSLVPHRIDGIVRTIGCMALMIDDLVESLSFDSRHLHLSAQAIDLTHLIRQICSRAQVLRPGKIAVEARPGALVLVDPVKTERCIMNLVSNAIKYSPADAPVLLRVSVQGDTARLDVCDRGLGIAAKDLPRLFERFYRSETAGSAVGLGLGLFIAKHIAIAHGGDLFIKTTSEKGSVFTLTLPLLSRNR